MTDVVVACKAAATAVGGVVAVECAQVFLGIPRDVLYAAIAGACVGLAQRPHGDWEKFLAPGSLGLDYVRAAIRVGILAVKVAGNALICAWLGQLAQFLPLTSAMAKVFPMAVAGVLGWMSWTLAPAALDSAKEWMHRKAGGG